MEILIFVACFVCGLFTSMVAKEKNHGSLEWFLWGLFFNFIALIAIAGMPVKNK